MEKNVGAAAPEFAESLISDNVEYAECPPGIGDKIMIAIKYKRYIRTADGARGEPEYLYTAKPPAVKSAESKGA